MEPLPTVEPAEMDLSARRMRWARKRANFVGSFPHQDYRPSEPCPERPYANQIGFHKSRHTVRVMVPGNGWGKTLAMGAEANWWGLHEHPYQPTPTWPVLMLWFAKLSDQFELVKEQLRERIIGSSAQWRVSDGEFRWPDGSRLVLGLADDPQAWQKWQGVPVDLVFFDEQPPVGLWREMAMRRRAQRKTRFVFGATATGGASWMEDEFWRPWADWHRAKGLRIEDGLWDQSHPDYWVWDRGGLADNPVASKGDIAWYESRPWSSAAEKKVRLHGGFGRFSGNPVFDHEGIERQLVWASNEQETPPRRSVWIVGEDDQQRRWSVLEHDVEKVREWPFMLVNDRDPSGRLDVWEEPEDGLIYVIGGDCAYGLKDRDYDTAIVLAKGRGPLRQVAEACGHWGERFDRVVYALARYYSDAFVCLERQVGLPIMRRLYRDFGYRNLYYERDETKRGRDVLDSLGHPRTHDDFTLRNLRLAVADGSLVVRSKDTLEQMRSLEYYSPREDAADRGSRVRDQELRIRLPGGGSPDLVMGAAYALLAAGEVSKFETPKPKYGPGTYGAIFGHEESERRRIDGDAPKGLGWRVGK